MVLGLVGMNISNRLIIRKKMYNRVDNDVDMKIINTAELPQASRMICCLFINRYIQSTESRRNEGS